MLVQQEKPISDQDLILSFAGNPGMWSLGKIDSGAGIEGVTQVCIHLVGLNRNNLTEKNRYVVIILINEHFFNKKVY